MLDLYQNTALRGSRASSGCLGVLQLTWTVHCWQSAGLHQCDDLYISWGLEFGLRQRRGKIDG